MTFHLYENWGEKDVISNVINILFFIFMIPAWLSTLKWQSADKRQDSLCVSCPAIIIIPHFVLKSKSNLIPGIGPNQALYSAITFKLKDTVKIYKNANQLPTNFSNEIWGL